MTIDIKPLTPDIAGDYFDFFDNRAFTDHAEWSCCYCTWFHMDRSHEQKIGEAVKSDGGTDALRRALRETAKKFVREGTLKGYLAYADDVPIGWCNANDKAAFNRFDLDAEVSGFIRGNEDNVKSVTCFTIAPEYREKGIATALLKRVVQDAKAEGYSAVEGYSRLHDEREAFDFTGPVRLYEKAGFTKTKEKGKVIIMRHSI